jgi:ElaB/YqjD/DUF883 family membrane-anchored ribosome-binding protein
MDDSRISDAVGAVTDSVRNGAASVASEAERQIRENGPRLMKSAQKSYEDANDYVGGVIANRQLPAILAAGAIGLLLGLTLSRR